MVRFTAQTSAQATRVMVEDFLKKASDYVRDLRTVIYRLDDFTSETILIAKQRSMAETLTRSNLEDTPAALGEVILVAETNLGEIERLLGSGYSPSEVVELTHCAFKTWWDCMSPFLPLPPMDRLYLPLSMRSTALMKESRRKLYSVHGTYLILLFIGLAEQLLPTKNDAEYQGRVFFAQRHYWAATWDGFDISIQGFRYNWPKLRENPKVKEKPDMWCSILQARNILALAFARACLVPYGTVHPCVRPSDVGYNDKTGATEYAMKVHLSEAKEYARWIEDNKISCSEKVKASLKE